MSRQRHHPLLPEMQRLRAEGLSMAAIGRVLGVTKNVVVGAWKRAGLADPSANPVKAGVNAGRFVGVPQRRQRPRSSAPGPAPKPAPASPAAQCPAPAPVVPPAPLARAAFSGKVGACHWPEGTRGAYRFDCTAPSLPGKPYCRCHYARAYAWPKLDAVAA